MSKIPSKADFAISKAARAEADRRKRIKAEVKQFTNYIVAAMRRGESSLSKFPSMPGPEAQTQLKSNFAPEWTLHFDSARSGGTICWS